MPRILDTIISRFLSARQHGCRPVFGRGHPFCFQLDPPVVVVVDAFGDGLLEFLEGPGLRFVPAGHLVLHDAEERFHHAVVDAVALPGHGLGYPLLLEPFPVEVVLVLPAHVTMEDEALEVLVLRPCPSGRKPLSQFLYFMTHSSLNSGEYFIKKCPISRAIIVHFDTFVLYQNVSYKLAEASRFELERREIPT